MISAEKTQVLAIFAEGRKLYKLMKFKEAAEKFAAALVIDPQDGPSAEYFKRCNVYASEPPEEDWDGVFVMKHK